MKKYLIGTLEFNTKKEITEAANTAVANLKLDSMTDNDRKVLFGLIEYHPNKSFVSDAKYIGIRNERLVVYNTKSMKPFSVAACIQNMPVIESDFTFTFGKYIGLTLQEVFDIDTNYLEWIASDAFIDKIGVKSKLSNFYRSLELTITDEMNKAIEEERYEDAAKLRDKLKKN